MKLIYIADNRCRANFGCRATSIALSQLVSREHEIVATVSGEYTHESGGPTFFIPGLPRWAYILLGKLPLWYLFRVIWSKIIRRNIHVYRFFDFANEDQELSIKRFCRCLPANPHLKEFDIRAHEFDGVVINGEGTMIMTNPLRRDSLVYLMFCTWAKNLGKKVYLVNAMFSDCPATTTHSRLRSVFQSALSMCDVITTRDQFSLDYINDNFKGLKASYIPDALFTWRNRIENTPSILNGSYILPFGQESDDDFIKFDFSSDYICVSGSSSAAWNQKRAYESYKNLVLSLKNKLKLPIYLIQVCEGDKFLLNVGQDTDTPCLQVRVPLIAAAKILSESKLYISGRFHPGIMASLGGTPCVFLGSNSHKTMSIQNLLDYEEVREFPALPDAQAINDIVDAAQRKLSQESDLREKIKATVSSRDSEAQLLLDMLK